MADLKSKQEVPQGTLPVFNLVFDHFVFLFANAS